jgi:hypothetical protein
MEARSEFCGEKQVSLKPPMDVPIIIWSCEFHSPRSYHETVLELTRVRSGSTF